MLNTKLRSVRAIHKTLQARKYNFNSSENRIGFIYERGANLGDEIMLEAAQTLISNSDILRFTRWENIFDRIGLSGKTYFKYVILGGGTLIHNENIDGMKMLQKAQNQGLPVWSLGTGVGSSCFGTSPSIGIDNWKPILSKFVKIGVRGPISKSRLESIGINNVKIVGDLALSFTKNHLGKLSEKPKFAVNLRLPQSKKDQNNENILKFNEVMVAISRLVEKGWTPVPIAMHPSDIEPLEHLLSGLSIKHSQVFLASTLDQFFQLVNPCSFMIGVRLHSAVLSCCAGVPPLMIGYRDKCLDFMQSMNLEKWYVDFYTAKPNEISEKALLLSEQSLNLRPIVLSQSQLWKSTLEEYALDTLKIMEK